MRTPKQPKPWKQIKRRVYKPTGFGDGFQPDTVESELIQRCLRRDGRKDKKAWAKLRATRSERER